jgi:hypothetical protein
MNDITTYSIAIGLIIYTSIYLYLLFYNDEYLSIFNKFIIYIIAIDLLLSTFYYLNNDSNKTEYNTIEQSIDDKPQNDKINSSIEIFNNSDYSDTYSDTEDSLSENNSFKNDDDDDVYPENNIIESDSQIIVNQPILDNIIQNLNLEETKLEETKLENQDIIQQKVDIKIEDIKIEDIKMEDLKMEGIQMKDIINNIKLVEKDNIVTNDNLESISINKSDFVTLDTSDIIDIKTTTKKKRGRKPNSVKL